MSESIDCSSFIALVQLILDGEATEEQIKQFEHHVATSENCAEWYKCEKCAHDTIKKHLCVQPIPKDLPDIIRKKITEVISKS